MPTDKKDTECDLQRVLLIIYMMKATSKFGFWIQRFKKDAKQRKLMEKGLCFRIVSFPFVDEYVPLDTS